MAKDRSRAPATEVVLLDALGTLVGLEPPAPHLVAALAARGVDVPLRDAGAAMAAEMTYYRREHGRAGTPEGLAGLRSECAAILGDALGAAAAGLSGPELQECLLGALRFFAYPEAPAVLAELHDRGLRLVICSNWDLSLHEVLAATGLDALVDGVAVSAVEGVAKPGRELFVRALALAGDPPPQAAVHVGDSVATDVMGALGAGVRPVLLRRAGDEVRSHDEEVALPAGVPLLTDLRGLPALV